MIKKTLILGILSCLSIWNIAFAAEDSSTPARERDDIRFECSFRGSLYKKEPIYCEAHGQFDSKKPAPNRFISGDRDDFLVVRCGDQTIYDGDLLYGIFKDRDDHDKVFDLKLLSETPFTAAIKVEDINWHSFGGPYKSNLSIRVDDHFISLYGHCHFRHDHREPPTLN